MSVGFEFFFSSFFLLLLSRVYFSCQKPTAYDYGADNYKEEVISLKKKKAKKGWMFMGAKGFLDLKLGLKLGSITL